MGIRTVRLDQDTEKILAAIVRKTDLTITGVIKKSLVIFYEKLQQEPARKTAFEVYSKLDLGSGDSSIPDASNSKQELLKILQRKHNQ